MNMTTQLTKALALGSSCAACGAGRKAKNLRYDPQTFLPYCDAPHICNEQHPNSHLNLIQRQSVAELVSSEEIKEAYQKHLMDNYTDSDAAGKIHRLMLKPTTIRIMDPEMAEYLVNLQEDKSFVSLAETIRYCIQVMMENQGTFYKEHQEKVVEQRKVEQAVEAVKELEVEKPEVGDPVPENDEEGLTF
jgi:hypothetical protein